MLPAQVSAATITPLISYQGRLLDNSSSLVSSTMNMTFRLYDAQTGGIPLWSETKNVQITNGIFNTYLGDTAPLNVPQFNNALWIEIVVGGETLTPRQQLTGSPYAFGLAPGAMISNLTHDHEGRYARSNQSCSIGKVVTGVDADGDFICGETSSNLEARLAKLESLLNGVNRSENDIYFNGTNIHITDGSGSTDGDVNGLGNLIIGYNELRGSGDNRTGSHNLILGSRNNFGSYGGLVAGYNNAIVGAYASVSGGFKNTASGIYSSISGGMQNNGKGKYSSVKGGGDNIASNDISSVNGGQTNNASGLYSSITGGYFGKSTEAYSSVNGGEYNTASGWSSVVSGGKSNIASGWYSSVSGGWINNASGEYSSVSGGKYNSAAGSQSSVSGGWLNTANGLQSSIIGGSVNTASGVQSSVIGGSGNAAIFFFSTVCGGSLNIAEGEYSSISGGNNNTASGKSSSVSGGNKIQTTLEYSWAAGSYHYP